MKVFEDVKKMLMQWLINTYMMISQNIQGGELKKESEEEPKNNGSQKSIFLRHYITK